MQSHFTQLLRLAKLSASSEVDQLLMISHALTIYTTHTPVPAGKKPRWPCLPDTSWSVSLPMTTVLSLGSGTLSCHSGFSRLLNHTSFSKHKKNDKNLLGIDQWQIRLLTHISIFLQIGVFCSNSNYQLGWQQSIMSTAIIIIDH